MADLTGYLPQTQSFLDWLRKGHQGRGIPTWTRPGPGNAQGATGPVPGRYGGYPGWERGMPLAPDSQGGRGGTYAASGKLPALSTETAPGIGGRGAGLPPNLGSGIGSSGPSMARALGVLGRYGPGLGIAGQHDIGWPARTAGADPITWLQKWRAQQQQSQAPQAQPIPNAPANQPPAQLIPPAMAGQMKPIPVGTSQVPPTSPSPTQNTPPPWQNKTPLPNSSVPWPKSAPSFPETAQSGPTPQIPLPRPRSQAQIPLPRPRPSPSMPTKAPQTSQEAQNQSILDVLLNSFNPNAEWRKQYQG